MKGLKSNNNKCKKTKKNAQKYTCFIHKRLQKKFFFYISMIIICNKNHKQLGCAVNSKTKLYIMLLR